MTSKNLDTIIIRIVEEKEEQGPLHVDGLENIHPMHEALVALFKQNLNDQEIAERYAKNAESIREVLVVDALLPYLNSTQCQSIKHLLSQGSPLKEILEHGALLLAEERRIRDGNVIRNAENYGFSRPYLKAGLLNAPLNLFFKLALSTFSPRDIYFTQQVADKLKEKEKTYKTCAMRTIAIGAVAALILGNVVYSYRSAFRAGWDAFKKEVVTEQVSKELPRYMF